MELQRGLSIIPFLFKKDAYFCITYHIPLPWAVFALQVHPKTVTSVDMTLFYLCFLFYPFHKGSLLVLCLGNPAGTPRAQCTTQLRVHPNVHLQGMWTNLDMLQLGKISPSMLFATWWHLNQCGECQLDWGPPRVTVTPCDSGLGGTCWQAEISVNSSENEITLVAKHSVIFRPSRNAHLHPMETLLRSPWSITHKQNKVKVKSIPYQPKVRLSYWRVASWLTAAALCAIPWINLRKQTLHRQDGFQKPVKLLMQELKWENTLKASYKYKACGFNRAMSNYMRPKFCS